jgi:hypothetical protein
MTALTRTAILGTGQVAAGNDESGTFSDELVARVPSLSREWALLLRAGAATVVRLAGARPLAVSVSDQAPPETRLRVPTSVSQLLAAMLNGAQREVLPEALEVLAARGFRLPEELLPIALIEEDEARRTLLAPVLGERGRWLARQRDEWAWANVHAHSAAPEIAADADERWAEGTDYERQRLLALVRTVAPGRARAWVESTFKADKPEQRALWIKMLEPGLSSADVPFLESALTDRSQAVRTAAARVLWLLPESGAAKALQQRLADLFLVNERKLAPSSKLRDGPTADQIELDVCMPTEPFDKALDKLGVAEHPPGSHVGRRQWWLAQHVAAVHPDWFCTRVHATPSALVQAAIKHDLGAALLNGWTQAAFRFRADIWFAPLWDAWHDAEEPRSWFEDRPLDRLTAALTPEQREPRLLECVRDDRFAGLLQHLPRPWPASIAHAVVARLRAGEKLRAILPLAATRLPLDSVKETLTLPPAADVSPSYARAYDDFLATLDFRVRLNQELAHEH